jgi:hypothetical protein
VIGGAMNATGLKIPIKTKKNRALAFIIAHASIEIPHAARR